MVARALGAAGALMLAAMLALAAPTMTGNAYNKARKGIVFDSLSVPNGRSRGVYLIDVAPGAVRSNMDSTLNLWFNGGATPKFRRIQNIKIWTADATASVAESFELTIYRDGATSRNKLVLQPYTFIELPLEADSLRFTSRTTLLELSMVYW